MRKSEARRLLGLEETYRDLLVTALRKCAAGEDGLGLFGHSDRALEGYSRKLAARLRPAAVGELLDLGNEIGALRERLGYIDVFPLHARFMSLRASNTAHTLGQPRLAKQWLEEIEAEPREDG